MEGWAAAACRQLWLARREMCAEAKIQEEDVAGIDVHQDILSFQITVDDLAAGVQAVPDDRDELVEDVCRSRGLEGCGVG
jgi:hypothetical protein